MCNEICAHFLLSSSSSVRGAAGRGAGRADRCGQRCRQGWQCVTVSPRLSGLQEDPKRRHPLAWLPRAGWVPHGRLSLVLDVSDAEREPVPAHELRAGGSRRCR